MANALDAVLAQYEKNTAKTNGGNQSISQEDRLKRYFTTYLPKGTKGGQKTVRILPTSDGSSPFKEVWYHEIQIDGKWTKLYDPGKNDGERSPLTEVYEELTSTGKESDKDLARQYRPRKFYIVKLVDRDNEDHGPKFWRFKDNYKQEGILDKIIPIWKAKGDVTDANEGRDLMVELLNDTSGLKCATPSGAFYAFPDFSAYLNRMGNNKLLKDTFDISEYILDSVQVVTVPGDGFGASGHIRFSYATNREIIKEGIDRVRKALRMIEE